MNNRFNTYRHNKWNYIYAYSARGEAWSDAGLEPEAPDLEGWSPDLADWADAWACTREDEELQAVYEEQLADYQRQMEYAYDTEEARRLAQLADLDHQTAPWGHRWY